MPIHFTPNISVEPAVLRQTHSNISHALFSKYALSTVLAPALREQAAYTHDSVDKIGLSVKQFSLMLTATVVARNHLSLGKRVSYLLRRSETQHTARARSQAKLAVLEKLLTETHARMKALDSSAKPSDPNSPAPPAPPAQVDRTAPTGQPQLPDNNEPRNNISPFNRKSRQPKK